MTAQEAAGVIHSDFFSKFIRAEVVSYDHFMAAAGSSREGEGKRRVQKGSFKAHAVGIGTTAV